MPACPSCGQENPEGFKFCGACGSAIEAPETIACPQCGQANPAGLKFCGACGSPLAAPEPEPEEERKVVTALFTDIVGSTASAEQLDPEDVRARLSPYYTRVRVELETFGGTVEKFIGDAVVALFGAPVAHEDDPERAVRAALAVQKAVEELNAEDEWLDIHIRTAVHTGEALVVVGAKAAEGEGMAAGDVMNTAARLQGGAPVDGIVVGEATYRATMHAIEYREAEPVQAKGKTEPIPIWEVVGEKAAPERPVVRTPLVGREEELARLTDLWQIVLDEQHPRLVTLLGPPGIGKSRLLAALCDQVEEVASVHWGRCLPYGEGMTYWPITEIIKSAAGIRHDDDCDTDSAKLGRLLERLPTTNEDELRTIAAALANLVGVATTPRGTYSAEVISQAELHWGIRRVLRLLAGERPMMLVFEDLHWAEPTLIELLQSFPLPDGQAPFLIVCSARPELAETYTQFVAHVDGRETISLTPLGEDDIEQMLTELLADTAIDSEHLQRLVRNAGGNPLFLEETVRMVVEAKDSESDLENLPVPETVQALIGSRLDSLPGSDKRVAQQASVVGNVFWPGAVSHIGGLNGDLQPSLDTLERRDFVHARLESTVAGEREYAFKHILIRDVAYERLPKGRRAELHVRFSDWVRGVAGAEEEFIEILAFHLEQACRLATAVAHSPVEPPVLAAADALSRSARKAERREGLREAVRFYTRALELTSDTHPETAAELRLRRGQMHTALGELRKATRELAEVAEQAVALGRRDLRCGALISLADGDKEQGRLTQARERLTEAQSIASDIGDRVLQVRAAYEIGTLSGDFEGDLEPALEELGRGIAIAEELDNRGLLVEGHFRMGTVLFNGGRLARAEEHLVRSIDVARELGSLRDEARLTSLLGLLKYYSSGADEAEPLALQAREWLERTAESTYQIQNLRQLGFYALLRGEAKVAEEWFREALPIALEMGGWQLIEIYRYLVEALVRQDRLEDARELAAFAGRNLSGEDPYAQVQLLIAEAFVAAGDGDVAGTTERFREALRRLEEEEMPIVLAETRIDYARGLRWLDECDAARVELEQGRETFAQMGADAVLAEIDAELQALIGGGAGVAGPTTQ